MKTEDQNIKHIWGHTANSWFASLRIRGESAHMEIAHLGHGLSKTPGSWNCLYNFLAEKNSTLVGVDKKMNESLQRLSGSDLSEKSQREQSRSGISVLNPILMLLLCVQQPELFQTVCLGLLSRISFLILLCISIRTNNNSGLSVSRLHHRCCK